MCSKCFVIQNQVPQLDGMFDPIIPQLDGKGDQRHPGNIYLKTDSQILNTLDKEEPLLAQTAQMMRNMELVLRLLLILKVIHILIYILKLIHYMWSQMNLKIVIMQGQQK